MQHQEFLPTEELRSVIKCFWYDSRNLGKEPTAFEVVPDGYVEIIFHFGNNCSMLKNGSLQPLPSPFIMGLLNQPVTFHSKNRLHIIGIRSFPWAVFDLLGVGATKEEIRTFKHPISMLQAALNDLINAGKIAEAIATVEKLFLNNQPGIAKDSLLFKAGTAMLKANGTMPVNEIAIAAHATVRTLERKFKASSAHTIKNISALMRFEQLRNALWLRPKCGLAALAQEFGYADQSHLSRQFKRFSGTTPAAFVRNAKKARLFADPDLFSFVQD